MAQETVRTAAAGEAGDPARPLLALEAAYRRFRDPHHVVRHGGRISEVTPVHYRVRGLSRAAHLGDIVSYRSLGREHRGEVVRISAEDVLVAPFEPSGDASLGQPVFTTGPLDIVPHASWRGRVIDALARPLDDGPALIRPVASGQGASRTPPALRRERVAAPFLTGVRVIDLFTPLCHGQRIGIFAGSGVGKSTLLSMIVRNTEADINVLALIGERGREVREFVEHDLGPEGLARSVVVVATSDQPALVRTRAAFAATRIAEWFRDQGRHVNLLMDSLTRFSMAQREIGLSSGEVPATRGYPPSVFALMPRLLERAGASERGSITGIYTVLVEGDDMNDPIGDTARSILDGHVTLSRELATAGHFPTVDVLESVSRVAGAVTTAEQRELATRARELMAAYREARDLVEIGAYQPGSNPKVDEAIARRAALEAFCRQGTHEPSHPVDSWAGLDRVLNSDLPEPVGAAG